MHARAHTHIHTHKHTHILKEKPFQNMRTRKHSQSHPADKKANVQGG